MALATLATLSLSTAVLLRYVAGVELASIPLLFLSTALTATCALTWWVRMKPTVFSRFKNYPTPNQGPMLQRLLKEPMADTTEKYLNEIPNDGVIRYFGMFNQERLMVTKPELVKQVMQTQGYNFVKTGLAAKVLRRIIPYGLLTTNDAEDHKFQRKVLSRAFKGSNIQTLFPVFWRESLSLSEALVENLNKSSCSHEKTPDCSINIWEWMTRATLDSIVVATFGGRWNAIVDPESSLVKSWNIIVGSDKGSALYRASALILPGWLWERLPIKARYRYDKAKLEIDSQTTLLIEERKAQILSQKPTKGPKIDILSEMLRSGHPKTYDKLLGQTLTFIAAGHDTTANGMTFILYLLATHPEIQDKARSEIHRIVPSPMSQSEFADSPEIASTLERLTYVQAVINEGLRLYAPIPHQRRVVKQHGSKLGDVVLPVGTTLVINPYSLNRSTKIWGTNATKFQPERWVDPETGAIDRTGGTGDPFAVATFGHGPRQCIGEKFARVELLAMLTVLLGRFNWSYVGAGEHGNDKLQVVFPIVTKPVGGLWLSYSNLESAW